MSVKLRYCFKKKKLAVEFSKTGALLGCGVMNLQIRKVNNVDPDPMIL